MTNDGLFSETRRGDGAIEVVLSSSLPAVDRAVAAIKDHLAQWRDDDLFDALLVTRELLNNAVEHGNRFRSDRAVTCRVDREAQGRLRIVVTDQGKGFAHGKADVALPEDPLTDRNRGLALVRAFSESLTFNGKGNRATVRIACGAADPPGAEQPGDGGEIRQGDPERLRIIEGERSVEMALRAEIHLVERAVQAALSFAGRFDPAPFPELEQVLRELLVNAVVHGSRNRPEKPVSCVVERVRDALFRIVVADQGDGFDPGNAPSLTGHPRPGDDGGGFGLVRSLCEQIDFNAAGNRVTVHLRRPVRTRFDVERQAGRAVVRPSGDITAASADALKRTLMDLAASGVTRYTFDFERVGEIDSLSLTLFVVFVKMLMKQGGRPDLEIVNSGGNLRKLFAMTRLDEHYRMV